jgi:DNA-binding PadR family transcriptional regulator
MSDKNTIERYLPLTESTFYTLVAVVEPLHGYGIMQKVETISDGAVKIGPGTRYGVLHVLETAALSGLVGEEERRKIYTITEKGRQVLKSQVQRLAIMMRSAALVGLEEA